ncbi:MAG: thiamine phosphate synthase [Bacteroidales bacterium]|nr:thiamine phosphate synthase [Bacteroidales bacterium]
MKDFGLYIIITRPVIPYSRIAEICVNNEIAMLQLREKYLSDKEIVKIGLELKSIIKGSKTNLVINDRPDIAVLCEADCLHLGQDDITYEDARKIVGNDMQIGLSTHSIQQAKDALKKGPDYIGFGPIYATTVKTNPDQVVGTDQLKEVLSFANVPVVAIGGIFPENIEAVLKTGARNIAMVRYFMQAEDMDKKIKEIKSLINK